MMSSCDSRSRTTDRTPVTWISQIGQYKSGIITKIRTANHCQGRQIVTCLFVLAQVLGQADPQSLGVEGPVVAEIFVQLDAVLLVVAVDAVEKVLQYFAVRVRNISRHARPLPESICLSSGE